MKNYITEKPTFQDGVLLFKECEDIMSMIYSLMNDEDTIQRATDLHVQVLEFKKTVESLVTE